jgi:hypothetical protein
VWQPRYLCPVVKITPAERDWLYHERLRAMDDYTALVVPDARHDTGGIPPRVGILRISGRDSDASIVASVRCGETTKTARYVRNLRTPRYLAWRGTRTVSLQRLTK